MGDDKDDKRDRREIFDEAHQDLIKTIDFALRVSEQLRGESTSDAGEMASMVHTRMCINAASAEWLCRGPLFDHSGIMAISRMVMEAMTVYFYLIQGVSPAEWECRRLTLRLHDTTARIKLLRAWKDKSCYRDLIDGRASLVARLQQNSFFLGLSPEQQKKLLSGEQIFVGGMLAAATRAVGWRKDTFLALYNYLSTHTHSAPMSFMRMRRHKIDYADPSGAQFDMARLAISVTQFCLLRVSLHYLDTSPVARASFDPEELAEFEKQDAESNLLNSGAT